MASINAGPFWAGGGFPNAHCMARILLRLARRCRGRTAFKHKRRKVGFSVITAILILLNLAILAGIVVLLWK